MATPRSSQNGRTDLLLLPSDDCHRVLFGSSDVVEYPAMVSREALTRTDRRTKVADANLDVFGTVGLYCDRSWLGGALCGSPTVGTVRSHSHGGWGFSSATDEYLDFTDFLQRAIG